MNHLQVLQNKVAKTILDLPPWNSASDALKTLNITPLSDRRFLHRCTMVYKCLSNSFNYDFNLTFNNMIHSYDTRNKNNLHLPRIRIIGENKDSLLMLPKTGTHSIPKQEIYHRCLDLNLDWKTLYLILVLVCLRLF